MALLLEVLQEHVELGDDGLEALEVVRGQLLELRRRREGVDELDDAAAVEVHAPKDGRVVEVELLRGGRRAERLLREAVVLLVRLVELEHVLEARDEHGHVLAPQVASRRRHRRRVELERLLELGDARGLAGRGRREHVRLGVRDHLVRDLDEEVRHALGRVEVARDCVHHLERVEQRRERVDDLEGRRRVERVQELGQRLRAQCVCVCVQERVRVRERWSKSAHAMPHRRAPAPRGT